MREFVKTSLAFTIGLVLVLAVTDGILGWRTAHLHGKTTLSPEIYQAIEKANEPSPSIHVVYLGDSVAHQLFEPGSETRRDELFLTSNQAGSLAAQYYILADLVRSCPNLREVDLFYYPGSFENDLGPPFANDYFCGFFHTPAQIREVYGVTRDFHLLLVQIGRLLMPNILATNSLNRPMAWEIDASRPTVAPRAAGSNPEPLMELLNRICGRKADDPPPPHTAAGRPVFLSRVSVHYLPEMRALCQRNGIAFHVLPCPCSDRIPFDDSQGIYDGPIIYRPAAQFGDGIHVMEPFREQVRRELETTYGLPSERRRYCKRKTGRLRRDGPGVRLGTVLPLPQRTRWVRGGGKRAPSCTPLKRGWLWSRSTRGTVRTRTRRTATTGRPFTRQFLRPLCVIAAPLLCRNRKHRSRRYLRPPQISGFFVKHFSLPSVLTPCELAAGSGIGRKAPGGRGGRREVTDWRLAEWSLHLSMLMCSPPFEIIPCKLDIYNRPSRGSKPGWRM